MASIATPKNTDAAHLRRALELAEGGRGKVSPNPLVGAVLARGDEIIGEGFHAELGGLHAERAALADCAARGSDPEGAVIYVTLEPCAHQGRQPPCAEALIEAKVGRVVYGAEDPTEKASGRGPGMLRDAGIEVDTASGPEATECRLLVQPFRKHARTGRPLVTYKVAMTLDGRVAAPGGDSRWISGGDSRELVHAWREDSDAIAVGIGTALADDPLLTARNEGAQRQPVRVVFDSQAALPLESALLGSLEEAPVWVITSDRAPGARIEALRSAGAEVIPVPGGAEVAGHPVERASAREARVSAALAELGRRDIHSLFLEGGPTLAGSFLDAGEIDELRLFIAPVLLGAGEARAVLEGEGARRIADAVRPLEVRHEQIGDDLLVRARIKEW